MPNRVLAAYEKATKIPLVGRGAFSLAFAAKALYFLTIQPTIPPHLRWIPKGMELRYLDRATSTLTAIADTDPDDWAEPGEVPVQVRAVRSDGATVVEGVIRLHTSLKK